jgi:hypothetical protein
VHVAPAAVEVPKLTNRQVLENQLLLLIELHKQKKNL